MRVAIVVTSTSTDLVSLADTTSGLAHVFTYQPETFSWPVSVPSGRRQPISAVAMEVAELLGIDFGIAPFTAQQFEAGLEIELELAWECPPSMVDFDSEGLLEIGRLAASNLQAQPDYYLQLARAHAPGDPSPRGARPDVGSD